MTRGVVFHEAAQREFDEATDFYAMDRVAVGLAFVSAIERTVAHACEYPESCVVLRGRVRKMHVARFPYSVVYSVQGDVIRVLAVAHDRRRPFYWSSRR